jgi:ribosomal protein S18 acetylase RimI-like enzyme
MVSFDADYLQWNALLFILLCVVCLLVLLYLIHVSTSRRKRSNGQRRRSILRSKDRIETFSPSEIAVIDTLEQAARVGLGVRPLRSTSHGAFAMDLYRFGGLDAYVLKDGVDQKNTVTVASIAVEYNDDDVDDHGGGNDDKKDGHARGSISHLYVAPTHRQQGVGKLLLAAAEQGIKERAMVAQPKGRAKSCAAVLDCAPALRSYYEKLGYSVIAERPQQNGKPAESSLLCMYKLLAAK